MTTTTTMMMTKTGWYHYTTEKIKIKSRDTEREFTASTLNVKP